ncbi:type II toxin-antitoxin system Phd/YefM family antitoxin [Neisseria sp. ZJ106]|uniref:Antitoxin n=1 Tax=Neisseria lisongii TaxID=2912188 RepID=A0ABY7RJW2_9NEIS|nr:type II toxin-antitoxin system Phd/YefM family antitoxin [Neisseria lisongii]MCF7521494.1 type II toxin-antitoxin system Phd/YefM family antitoxin [Neisseria lisongii]WCL71076.1 type II toxin-antitoxin system Phd/YefM family antitoxin [Neisseria lisongii]
MQIFSSREFNQRTSQAQKAAATAPVIITHRGVPAQVLLSYADYQKLTGKPQTALEILQSIEADAADIELEIPPRSSSQRPAVEFE